MLPRFSTFRAGLFPVSDFAAADPLAGEVPIGAVAFASFKFAVVLSHRLVTINAKGALTRFHHQFVVHTRIVHAGVIAGKAGGHKSLVRYRCNARNTRLRRSMGT